MFCVLKQAHYNLESLPGLCQSDMSQYQFMGISQWQTKKTVGLEISI